MTETSLKTNVRMGDHVQIMPQPPRDKDPHAGIAGEVYALSLVASKDEKKAGEADPELSHVTVGYLERGEVHTHTCRVCDVVPIARDTTTRGEASSPVAPDHA